MGLTHKRQVFIEEYLSCWNATKAATVAGYAHPRQEGSRLLSNDYIQGFIKARIAEKAMSADEVLLRLAEQARGDIADALIIDGGIVMVDMDKLRELGLTHLVKKLKHNPKGGLELELYDAQAALVHIGRHHGLFIDRTQLSGDKDAPLTIVNWDDATPSRN